MCHVKVRNAWTVHIRTLVWSKRILCDVLSTCYSQPLTLFDCIYYSIQYLIVRTITVMSVCVLHCVHWTLPNVMRTFFLSVMPIFNKRIHTFNYVQNYYFQMRFRLGNHYLWFNWQLDAKSKCKTHSIVLYCL